MNYHAVVGLSVSYVVYNAKSFMNIAVNLPCQCLGWVCSCGTLRAVFWPVDDLAMCQFRFSMCRRELTKGS